MSINSYFLLLIFLIFSTFKLSYSKKTVMQLEGDAFDKELKNSIESKTKLFLIFYINKCPYCAHSIKVLNEKIINNYEEEDEINFGTVNLDRQENIWLGVRFNITKIPFIILIENNKMYKFQKQFEESVVLKFIEDEKEVEDAFDIPEDFGITAKINAVFSEFNERIRVAMQLFLDKYGIGIKWTYAYTNILLLLCLVAFIYIENKILGWIRNTCRVKKDENTENNKDNNDNVESKDEKEESEEKVGKEEKEEKKKTKKKKEKKE